MARVTVEDCLENLNNRFALVVLASRRARQIARGAEPLVDCNNKEAVTALREIAEQRVRFAEDLRETITEFVEEQRHSAV